MEIRLYGAYRIKNLVKNSKLLSYLNHKKPIFVLITIDQTENKKLFF